eukprot:TRINITY_DN10547_c0_g1_i1.p1 TRINITY_DN10547_c0_g1~~TRINITY_DN10547_c0_g1_i1.p1  ORF type:complete len:108 (+),score=0.43 TRINITY_DN10547_c0_g1_i1:2-325(+)
MVLSWTSPLITPSLSVSKSSESGAILESTFVIILYRIVIDGERGGRYGKICILMKLGLPKDSFCLHSCESESEGQENKKWEIRIYSLQINTFLYCQNLLLGDAFGWI